MSKRQISKKGLDDIERQARKVLERRRFHGVLRWLSWEATMAASVLVMVDEIRRLWEIEDETR